jgi:uncharacterized membrane protein YadS
LLFFYSNPQVRPGIDFCGRRVLHFGVALLGARITINRVSALGIDVAAVVGGRFSAPIHVSVPQGDTIAV